MNQERTTQERVTNAPNGLAALVVLLAVGLFCAWRVISAAAIVGRDPEPMEIIPWVLAIPLLVFCLRGLLIVQPNQGVVLQLFGRYSGTVREAGLKWVNPFCTRKGVSLRVRNFETNKLKVNDYDGNPIEIGAIVVWKVVDTASAIFQVDDYENYVRVQSESAVRILASAYAYDSHDDTKMSLRSHTSEVVDRLKHEVSERLAVAGVEVVEARLSHLAYAPEIAASMLQRQQASAIVAARTKIVEGAVGMVELALLQLSEKNVVNLDEDRKAAMVSNLLVVLCGERATQPVVNTGTIYQ
jgi:SPFH domain / Band 7 family